MAPILKDSDTFLPPGTAPETATRSGLGGASTESASVKAQPVALEIPITVNGVRTAEGGDKREPFSESTKTVMVFGSGAVIRMTSAMTPGQLLFLTNDRTKKEVVCQVVKSKNYRNVSGYVELEFTEPAVGFWGMRFPGDRIGPGPQAAQAETRTPAAGNGAPAAAAPVRPAVPKAEPQSLSSAPNASVNVAKPAVPAPSASKPAAPTMAGSAAVPPVTDSVALLSGAPKPKPDTKVFTTPIATTLGADTPLVEPWLKKREPAPRVPAAPASVAPPAPSAKPAEPEASLTPVRSFAVERPSEKAASLFAPAESPTNLASVDLSTIAPFFEVKPAQADVPAELAKAPAASDAETQELKQQTARLQDQLAKMQFAETDSSSTAKAEAEKLEGSKLDGEKPGPEKASPEMEISAFPLTEQSIETLKTELVHENAVQLMESPEPTDSAPVLAEISKLDEPLKVEPSAVIPAPSPTIPALDSLEQEEMKIPAWLAPLARNSSAPASTQELVLREKAKRRSEQPPLQELVAPFVAPVEEPKSSESRVPQFGSALAFEETKSIKQSSPKRSGKGMMLGGIAAGILALAGGGWWYMNRPGAGPHTNVAAAGSPADLQTSAMKESVLGTTPARPTDPPASEIKAGANNSNTLASPAGNVSSSALANSAAGTTRGSQVNSNGLNGGSVAAKDESMQSETVHEVEKKPAFGEVHLAAPKISQKRTVQAGAAPDAVLSDEPPAENADSLGGLAVASNQPAAPAAPMAVGGDVKQAKLISSMPPVYPAMAKTQRISGAVTIDALIDANGRVTTMTVISGPTLLQEAAKDALKQWRYQPATLDGKAVPMHLTVTLQFRLQE